jgi:hypothetical protein
MYECIKREIRQIMKIDLLEKVTQASSINLYKVIESNRLHDDLADDKFFYFNIRTGVNGVPMYTGRV